MFNIIETVLGEIAKNRKTRFLLSGNTGKMIFAKIEVILGDT